MAKARDSAEPVAALITINFETEEVLHTVFRGGDPIGKAEALHRSVEDDWPDHDQHIIGNKAALEVAGKRRMKGWFGIDKPSDSTAPEGGTA